MNNAAMRDSHIKVSFFRHHCISDHPPFLQTLLNCVDLLCHQIIIIVLKEKKTNCFNLLITLIITFTCTGVDFVVRSGIREYEQEIVLSCLLQAGKRNFLPHIDGTRSAL